MGDYYDHDDTDPEYLQELFEGGDSSEVGFDDIELASISKEEHKYLLKEREIKGEGFNEEADRWLNKDGDLVAEVVPLGYGDTWESMEIHGSFYGPAYRHYRDNQHKERYYVRSRAGELVPNLYERARGKRNHRRLRSGNREYYNAKARAGMAKYYEKNREKIIKKRAEAKAKDPEKIKEQNREAARRYRAKKKLLKQQQEQFNNLTGNSNDE